MAEFQTNLDKLAASQTALVKANNKLVETKATYDSTRLAWQTTAAKRDGGYCQTTYNKASERSSCQSKLNSEATAAESAYTAALTAYQNAAAAVPVAKALVEKYEDLVDSDIKNSGTLAQQGLTSTAVEQAAIVAAQGQAQALVATGNAQAEAIKNTSSAQAKSIEENATADAANKKTMKYIIIAVSAVVVVGIALFIYSKFKK